MVVGGQWSSYIAVQLFGPFLTFSNSDEKFDFIVYWQAYFVTARVFKIENCLLDRRVNFNLPG